jgi:hypothetical protein
LSTNLLCSDSRWQLQRGFMGCRALLKRMYQGKCHCRRL